MAGEWHDGEARIRLHPPQGRGSPRPELKNATMTGGWHDGEARIRLHPPQGRGSPRPELKNATMTVGVTGRA
jgi:hypothetical protein